MATTITRPQSGEYLPYYAQYISKVNGDDLFAAMQAIHRETQTLLGSLSDEQLQYRYAEGKWTIKDIVGHLIDAERIFAYRALRFARKDATDLAGFDENSYVPASNANERSIQDLLAEFTVVRAATFALFKSFSDEMLTLSGTANNNPISVRALAYIIGGHEMHHLAVIKERYIK